MKYYKVLTDDLFAPNHPGFSYKGWKNRSFKIKGKLEPCHNGLHLYKSLSNISIGNFGSRVFEAEPIGEILDDDDKICCREIKLIREIDIDLITDDEWIYHYCRYVKDRAELYSKLNDNRWIYFYCKDIRDRKELYNRLTDDYWIYYYCKDIRDRPELKKVLDK